MSAYRYRPKSVFVRCRKRLALSCRKRIHSSLPALESAFAAKRHSSRVLAIGWGLIWDFTRGNAHDELGELVGIPGAFDAFGLVGVVGSGHADIIAVLGVP